ncbi:MAG: helix-turn-helix domain-containing GNAT family N-acetyltransferase [Proteobacteria bacterium]|nr:helix-turn-helix domain-containing GNAT family N-acetyltransferase [Pseudomonadota bacterium]
MAELDDRVQAIRHFNRFYTKWTGLVTDRYLNLPYSLTEARVLYELFHQGEITATGLRTELSLDAGYLSRMLKGFERGKLIVRQRSGTDARQMVLRLTEQGRKTFLKLNATSQQSIEQALSLVPVDEQDRVVTAMQTIESLLSPRKTSGTPYLIRLHQPGDMGWVISQHGKLYQLEYNWDIRFEALVAEIAAKFINNFDARKECCWIAEQDGENIGSVFLVRHTTTIAKLRMLIVSPKARGMGVGTRLVDECIRFARQAGYGKIRLWTVSMLTAAKKLYQQAGFRLVKEEQNHSFGHDLTDETWELKL